MKYIRFIPVALVAALTFASCSNDDLDSTSIFPTGVSENLGTFENWIDTSFTKPYNIKVLYRYNDLETDQTYNVIPADSAKSVALAQAIKHVWTNAYNEVLGQDFLKQNCFRVFQFIGSPEYNSNGSMVLGTADGGIKVTLFNVNAIDPKNPFIDQDSPFPDRKANPMDMNYWYFHTMHHEFCHILTQLKDYNTDFRTISAANYQTTNWINVADADAPAMGFVSGYGSGEYNEDFAEIYSTYVTKTPEAWNKILQAGMIPDTTATGDIVYAKDKNGNYIYLTDANGNYIPMRNNIGGLVPETDANDNVVYQTDKNGNPVYYTVNGAKVPRYSVHKDLVYDFDSNGNVAIYFPYNGKYYSVLSYGGDPVYMTDADGNIVYDKDGNPVPEYFKVPKFVYQRQPSYNTTGRDAILKKLEILRDYFKVSWGLDIDKVRDVVLRRSGEITKKDLTTLK